MEFAFLDYTGRATGTVVRDANLPLWGLLITDAGGSRIVFAEPLTEEEMDALIHF